MSAFWTEVREILMAKRMLSKVNLNPPASRDEIISLERHLGVDLPQSLVQLLATHNGQDSGFGLFFGLHFLSISGIKYNWDNWHVIENDGMNEELADAMSSKPEGVIKPLYANSKWVPFTHDFGGNHLGLDFDPDKSGTLGQVITFGRDEDVKKLKANSFDEFAIQFIGQLKNISWEINDQGWVFDEEKYRTHYHDWMER